MWARACVPPASHGRAHRAWPASSRGRRHCRRRRPSERQSHHAFAFRGEARTESWTPARGAASFPLPSSTGPRAARTRGRGAGGAWRGHRRAWGLRVHAAPRAGRGLYSVRSPPARAAACAPGRRGRARRPSFQTRRPKPGGERLDPTHVWGKE